MCTWYCIRSMYLITRRYVYEYILYTLKWPSSMTWVERFSRFWQGSGILAHLVIKSCTVYGDMRQSSRTPSEIEKVEMEDNDRWLVAQAGGTRGPAIPSMMFGSLWSWRRTNCRLGERIWYQYRSTSSNGQPRLSSLMCIVSQRVHAKSFRNFDNMSDVLVPYHVMLWCRSISSVTRQVRSVMHDTWHMILYEKPS